MLLIPYSFYAQVEIKGIVKDSSNIAIEFANVVLASKGKGDIVSGTITDKKGYFKLLAIPGEYKLTISYIGHATESINILLKENKDLGVFILNESSRTLKDVVITSQKRVIEKKVDRLIFNVENSISISGGDVTDILKIAPYVRVKNDEVLMIGKSNLKILVNGNLVRVSRDNLTNFLKSIPADDIKKIEIITSPPAKYEAEGNSGLINIVYKKGITNSWKASLRGTYTQYTYPDGSLSGSFRYRENKTSLYINTSYGKGSKQITDTNIFEFDSQFWDSKNPRRIFYDNSLNTRIALDYHWSDHLTTGFQYQIGYNEMRIENNNDVAKIIDKSLSIIDSTIVSKSKFNQTNPLHSINFYADYKLDSIGKKISFNLDYFTFLDTSGRIYNSSNFLPNGQETPDSFSSGHNTGEQNINNYSFRADVEFPLKEINLNFGGKLSFINSDNDTRFFDLTTGVPILDLNQTNQFEYKENNIAFYVSGNKSFNEKWNTKVGFRIESTHSKGLSFQLNQINKNDYIKVFPSGYINYTPNNNHSFSLSYNKRISRPDFEYLNPFRITQNPYLFVEGNPFLQPSFSDNLEFTYLNREKWINSIYFSHIKSGFGQIAVVNVDTRVRGIIPQNYYNGYTLGLTESYTLKKWKGWESINTCNVNYSYADALLDYINDRRNGTNVYLSTNNNFTLNKDKTIMSSIDAWYNFAGVYDIYETSSSSNLNLSFKFLFLQKDLQLTITGSDLFKSQITEVTAFSNNVKTTYENYYDTRRLRFSLRYNFGNKKIKVNRKDFGNEEEKGRTGN